VEGPHFIEGHVERIEEVYKRGLRDLQLLHDNNDMVAPLGDINGGTSLGGLTATGAEVLKNVTTSESWSTWPMPAAPPCRER
jgi:membrane dipeptidase